MRARFLGLLLGCGVAAATIVSAHACPYQQTNASAEPTQQTAQAQTPAVPSSN